MPSFNFNKINLVHEVQKIINIWINENQEKRSIAYLSRKIGVSDSSLRRLMNNSIKINDDSIFKILSYISSANSFDKILNFFSPYQNVILWMNRHYSYMKNFESLQIYQHSFLSEEITSDAITFAIYMLVASVPNVDSSYIKSQYGIKGELELEKLIEKKIISLENGKLIAFEKKLKITREQAISLLPEITKIYLKKDHIFNARSLEIEAVSKEGYIKLMDLYENFLGNVSTILNSNPGEIPVVVAGFFDSLTTQPYFEEEKHVQTSH